MSPVTREDPFGAFHFLVEIDGVTTAGFQECSGLGMEVTVIEYRNGNEPSHVRKLPGLVKYNNIVLKRGVTLDRSLWDWFRQVINGKTERRSGSITLLGEDRSPVVRWSFREGWPCKYEAPLLNAKTTEVAIETLEIAIEGLELETP
jgi:phage tail-like protein